MYMLSQKSDDGPHIVVKTQSNITHNGSTQSATVPVQDWAFFCHHMIII
jgi:hypothetical protein